MEMTDADPAESEAADEGRRRFPLVPFRVLIPNMITLLAICSGLTAVRLSIEGRLEWAVGAVVVAAILDAIEAKDTETARQAMATLVRLALSDTQISRRRR